ncbi:bifunctional RNase H/acid phosphatase [Goodfellowiella coeruleoviolacea]|uniref:Phosphoglycerate mutase n=1 Tax=Goodfellowiella coeruleoviolacea TaxID=334858 RepID=A0AAE3GIV5_9PSEU|nr:bifunctional RNase H/acid phosphatase [Goodfellowiella coeruleoviolacea]MCP2168164.1 putative phosphoglycerate mutase [Goodfellowiella coeruleoviolacea]
MTTRVIVEADGGSRGNPGPAGYGAVVRDALTGEVLAERFAGLGVTTNNVAEYSGLVAGLRAARELGAHVVDVRMDSKLVVEQMTGRWKIKNAQLAPLAERARELSSHFAEVSYAWIPRESNKHADRLANRAMDEQRDGGSTRLDEPPDPPLTRAVPTAAQAKPELPGVEPPGTETADRSRPSRWNGAQGTPTKLLLLRHGQTEMSVERRYSGRGDVPLTEVGLRQVKAAAHRLAQLDGVGGADPAPVITSPLGRTRQTGQAVAEATGGLLRTHPGLVETDFGDWEGLTFAEAAQRDPELHARWLADPSVAPPNGESFDSAHQRVRRARDELVAEYAGRTIVVVSHVTPIKSLLRMGLDVGPSLLFRLHLDLASLSIVEFYPDGNASVRLVNDISHLAHLTD